MILKFPKVSVEVFSWADLNRVRVLIVLFVLTLIFTLQQYKILDRFEYVTYDYRCIARGARPAQPEIAVIEISDDSISKIGRWPWDRDWHASLIKILTDLGARAIVFDVLFSESSGAQKDQALAEAIDYSKKVYLAQVVEELPLQNKKELLTALPEFSKNAKGGGHINLSPDMDGVIRRVPLVLQLKGKQIPQLSFSVALDFYHANLKEVIFKKDAAVLQTPGGPLSIPLDSEGNLLINWAGWWHDTFKHYSYIDVISSYALAKKGKSPTISLDEFKGKICYVGTTASGLFDIRPTPLEPLYPAVGANLTLLNNFLEKKFIREFSYAENALILVALSICMFLITRSKSYFSNAFLTFLLATGYVVGSVFVFDYFGWWVNLIYPILLIFMTYYCVTMYNQFAIAIERSNLLKMATHDELTGLYNIGQFKLLFNAELATMALRRNDWPLTILMGDVDNFKNTNDTYGHLAGDQVLREVANAVKSTCRALDVAARYGGEEFIVMLPGANQEEAFKVAEKIRKAVNQKVFTHEKGSFMNTISIGIAQAMPGEKAGEAIIGRADKALYEAKRTGKNKVVIFKK